MRRPKKASTTLTTNSSTTDCADIRPRRFVVNYAANQSQCHVRLPFPNLAGKEWQLCDQLSPASYVWNGDDLQSRGLYLDLSPWQACVFSLVKHE